MAKMGIVYLVGAGPGDEELITVKGLRLLQDCEVVIYDRLVSPLLLEKVPDVCEKIDVGKQVGSQKVTQELINELLVKKALEGKRVVRLKGGDPFVFGRGGEEILALNAHHIPYEVIPGVTSALSVAAYGGIPMTHRGISQSFHVVTGRTTTTETGMIASLRALAALEGTLVFLMGMGHLEQLMEGLMQSGKSPNTPVAIISMGTTVYQREVRGTLADICMHAKKEEIKPPAIVIIGEVAKFKLLYKGQESLIGKRIGLMMTDQLSDKLAKKLERHGAKVIKIGATDIKWTEEKRSLLMALREIEHYRWLVFTSTIAVNYFFELVNEEQMDLRRFAHIKFAVVGEGTRKALSHQGFMADYMPETYTAEALGKGLYHQIGSDQQVLVPRAEKGSEALLAGFKEKVLHVTDIKFYDTVIDEKKLQKKLEQLVALDYLVFGSSASVQGFMEKGGAKGKALLTSSRLVCFGEVTAKTLEAHGYHQYLLPQEYTVDSLVSVICKDHSTLG